MQNVRVIENLTFDIDGDHSTRGDKSGIFFLDFLEFSLEGSSRKKLLFFYFLSRENLKKKLLIKGELLNRIEFLLCSMFSASSQIKEIYF